MSCSNKKAVWADCKKVIPRIGLIKIDRNGKIVYVTDHLGNEIKLKSKDTK